MSSTVCSHPTLPIQPQPAVSLLRRLQALWHPFEQEQHRHRLVNALGELNDQTLCDINAPEWLRRDLLHRAEMEHYEHMRTMSQFRGIL